LVIIVVFCERNLLLIFPFKIGLENPTYLKEPGDKLVVAFGFLSVTVGLTMIFRGLYSMTFGVNKIQKA
jgi:hypothetical protein